MTDPHPEVLCGVAAPDYVSYPKGDIFVGGGFG